MGFNGGASLLRWMDEMDLTNNKMDVCMVRTMILVRFKLLEDGELKALSALARNTQIFTSPVRDADASRELLETMCPSSPLFHFPKRSHLASAKLWAIHNNLTGGDE